LINFRYHLVSLTAVFLALALGVAVGAALIDRALVSALEDRLGGVEQRADEVDAENGRLETELGRWTEFAEQSGDSFVAGRLTGVPVALVRFAGVDGDVMARYRDSLVTAGATPIVELNFTAKFELSDSAAVEELAQIVGAPVAVADAVRARTLTELAASWAGARPGPLLEPLVAGDFVEVPGDAVPDLSQVAPRYLVASSADADVPNEELAIPLTQGMTSAGLAVVAVDVTRGDTDPTEIDEADPAPFVASLREEARVRAAASTVDHGGGFRGRVAAVLALAELGTGQVGQYGRGPGAERLLPD
jgi:hypothetical protein